MGLNVKLKKEGWVITDGSDACLQLGRKVNDSTWEYREWTDKPWYGDEEVLTSEQKLEKWDDSEWDEMTVDLNDYSTTQIDYYIDSYGYKLVHHGVNIADNNKLTHLSIKSGKIPFNFHHSVQLVCECIFESKA